MSDTTHEPSVENCDLSAPLRTNFQGAQIHFCVGCGTEYLLIGGFKIGQKVWWRNRAEHLASTLLTDVEREKRVTAVQPWSEGLARHADGLIRNELPERYERNPYEDIPPIKRTT